MVLRIIVNASNAAKPTTSSLARQAIKAYPRTAYTDRKAVNALRRGWIEKIQYLGPKWLLHPANAVPKKQAGVVDPDFMVVLCLAGMVMCALLAGVI